jgi:hypothetical protein
MLPTAHAGTGHARDAARDRGGSHSRLTGDRLFRAAEHGFYRAGQSDHSTWDSCIGSSHLGNGSAISTPVRPPGVVASLLSLRASPCSSACGTSAAARTRWQAGGSTLPAANTGDGSRQNHPTMDDARGAFVSLAKGLRLRGAQARGGLYHVVGRWMKIPSEEFGGSLTLGRADPSGLPHHQNRPAMSLPRADRFIHHVQWEHPPLSDLRQVMLA